MTGRFLRPRKLLVLFIASFLMLLHVAGLWDMYSRDHFANYSAFLNFQSILSLVIIASLVLVILQKKIGLIGMWIGITALILTQYLAHFGLYEADFTEGRSVFSYLRGFMIPTLITALYLLPWQKRPTV